MKIIRRAFRLPAAGWGAVLALAMPPLFRFAWDPFLQILVVCVIFGALAIAAMAGEISFSARRDVPLLAFLCGSVISFPQAADAAVCRNELLVLAAGCGLFIIAANLSTETVTRLTLVPLLAAAWHSVLLAAGTAATIGLLPAAVQQPVALLTVNANILAGFLVLCLPLSFIWWQKRDGLPPAAGMLFTLLIVVGILLTQSRAALLAALAIGGITAGRSRQPRVRTALCILLAAGVCVLALSPKFLYAQSLYERLVWAKTAVAQFSQHPFTGNGWGNYGALFIACRPELIQNTLYAHNLVFQLLAETGIIGVCAFSMLIWSLFRASPVAGNPVRPAALLALGAFLLANLLDYTFYIPAPQLLFWFCAGTVFARSEKPVSGSAVLPRMALFAAAAGALALAIPAGTGMLLAEQARRAEHPGRANELLSLAARHDPLPSGPYRRMAELAFQRYTATHDPQALRSAIDMQRRAVERNRADAAAWSDLAWLYITSRSWPEARHALLQAIRLDPHSSAYRTTLSLVQPASTPGAL